MNPDSLRLDDELARMLAAYDQGIGDADGEAPTLNIQELPPEVIRMLQRDEEPAPPQESKEVVEVVEPPSTSPGHRVGRFELRRLLGRGGFGIVFLAFDPKLRREVALKIPRPEMLLSADARRRLFREALAAAGFDHPNLVPVYETGEIGPVCFIATGFCPGETLAQWLDRQSFPVPVRQAARLVAILAEAVQHAHFRGVLHRDLKPNNVLMQVVPTDPADQEPAPGSCVMRGERFLPRVVDFGLAKVAERSPSDTTNRQIMGTPKYMAPEQAQARHEDIGPAADVYALGVILYELLTGRPPYEGETDVDVLRQSIEGNLTPPRALRPRIPRDLEAICLKAMARQPRSRYPTAVDLADDLRRFLTALPTIARPLGRRARFAKWLRRNDQMVALAFVTSLALFFLLVGTWSGYESRRLKDDHDTALKQQATSRQQDRDRLYSQAVRNAYLYWRTGDPSPMAAALIEANRLASDNREPACFAHAYLARLGSAPVRMITCPHGPALCLAVSVNGDRWATGHADGTLAVWDAAAGRVIDSVPTKHGPVREAAFLDGNQRIVIVNEGEPARIWEIEEEARLTGPTTPGTKPSIATCLAATADRKHVYIGTREGACFQVGSGSVPSAPFFSIDEPILGLAASPDGKTLAVTSAGTVSLWNTATGQKARDISTPGQVHEPLFLPSPRGDWSLGCIDEGVVRTLSVEGRASTVAAPTAGVNLLRASPDGQWLATGNTDDTLRIWDRQHGQLRDLLQGHSQKILAAEFTPNGRSLVSSSQDGTLATWDLTNERMGRFESDRAAPVTAVHFAPEHDHYVVASADGAVMDQDGKRIGSAKGAVSKLILPRGRTLHGIELTPGSVVCRELGSVAQTLLNQLAPAGSAYTTVGVSDDGRRLAAGTDHGSVTIWSLETGARLDTFQAEPDARIRVLSLLPEDSWLAYRQVGPRLGTFGHFGLGPPFESPKAAVLRYIPSTDRIAIAGPGSVVRICDRDGRTALTLVGHTGRVTGLAATPNGRTLASGSNTGEVKFWDLRTGQELFGMVRHSGPVTFLEFSPEGQRLLTGAAGWNGRFESALWDAGPQ